MCGVVVFVCVCGCDCLSSGLYLDVKNIVYFQFQTIRVAATRIVIVATWKRRYYDKYLIRSIWSLFRSTWFSFFGN